MGRPLQAFVPDAPATRRSASVLPTITPKSISNALADIPPCAAWNATSRTIAKWPNAKRVNGNVDSVRCNVRKVFSSRQSSLRPAILASNLPKKERAEKVRQIPLNSQPVSAPVVARQFSCQNTSTGSSLIMFHRAPASVPVRANEHRAWSNAYVAFS